MKLTSATKHDVKIGDVIRFSDSEKYLVINTIPGERGRMAYTLQDTKTKQVLYSWPASKCYGATVE